MRRIFTWLALAVALALLGVVVSSGLTGEDAPAVAHAGPSENTAFRAPDAKGWGRAGGLDYLEAVRGGAKASDRLPMVVLIHGLGDSPRADWLDLVPDELRARVVMPRAPEPWGSGFGWFPFRVGDHRVAGLAKRLDGRITQLAAAIQTLAARRPTLGKPIVGGFSQGGMLSFGLAVRHPDRYAFVLPISGLLPEALWPARVPEGGKQLPIRALHGAVDDVVPIQPARELVSHLKKLGFQASLSEFPDLGHSIDAELRARVISDLSAAVRGVARPKL